MILWKHGNTELHKAFSTVPRFVGKYVLKKTSAQLQPSLWQSSQSTELMCISTTVHLWRLLGHLARISAIHSPRTKNRLPLKLPDTLLQDFRQNGLHYSTQSAFNINKSYGHIPSIAKACVFFVQTCVFDLKDYYLTQKQGCTIDIKGPSPRPQAQCFGLDCKFLYNI